VPFGTTGEFASFTAEERASALEQLIEDGVPANRILVGTGAAAVPDAARLSRHATERGCLGVLVVPPFYFKEVAEAGLFRFLRSPHRAIRRRRAGLSLSFSRHVRRPDRARPDSSGS